MRLIVEIVSGALAGKKTELRPGQVVKFGRTEAADFPIVSDLQLSRVHFAVECAQQSCHVRDLGSSNGTFVNSQQITDAVLRDGDRISAGGTECRVRIEGAAGEMAPALSTAADVVQAPTARAAQQSAPVAAPTAAAAAVAASRSVPAGSAPPIAAARPSPRPLRGPRAFYIGLYEEHLEEASFLYDQRRTLFENPEITWVKIGEFEERFEAHIDALVVGEELALEVCKKKAAEGDAGEAHAAVRVFCRQNRKDLVLAALAELDPEDASKARAMGDALSHELPGDWQADLMRLLSSGEPKTLPVLAWLAGYRRFPAGPDLLRGLAKAPVETLPTVIWALGRIRDQGARPPLRTHYLKHAEDQVRQATALALSRLGEPQALSYCMQGARAGGGPFIPLGLGGGRAVVGGLLDVASSGQPAAECLLALGLLGDVAAVGTLLAYLANPELAGAAAMGLQLITGAGLCEQAFIPEEIDEDELFEAEREKLRRGEKLTGPGGRPLGATVTRVSQNPLQWQDWWYENRARFDPRLRYRSGQPFSPAVLVADLESEKSSHQLRRWTVEELVIRYGCDGPLETDMLVTQQQRVLAGLRGWTQGEGKRFRQGSWYFAGQMLPG